jgi:hypothetical protein
MPKFVSIGGATKLDRLPVQGHHGAQEQLLKPAQLFRKRYQKALPARE